MFLKISLRPKLTDTGLGIKIRGGIEHSLGVFISFVEPNSSAALMGLKVSSKLNRSYMLVLLFTIQSTWKIYGHHD